MSDGLKSKHRRAIIDILAAHDGVDKAVLFGSRATGTHTATSDVDIALFGDSLSLTDQLRLAHEIDELPMAQRVDLLRYKTIKDKKLRAHISKRGVEWFQRAGIRKNPSSEAERCWAMASDGFVPCALDDLADFRNGKGLAATDYIPEGRYTVWGANGPIARANKLLNPDPVVVIGRVGAYCGAVYRVKEPSWVTDNAIIATAKPGVDLGFLYYRLRSLNLRRTAVGSAQPLVTQGGLKVVKTVVPATGEQRAIAHILGTLDDKIELNRRVNETLEAIARAIFKSWFVDFDPVIDNALRAGNPIPDALAERAAQRRQVLAGAKGDAPRTEAEPPPPGLDSKTAALFPDSFDDSTLAPIPYEWSIIGLGDVAVCFDSKRIPLSRRERAQRRGSYPYYGAASAMDTVDDFLFDGIYVLMGEDGSVVTDDGHPVLQYVGGQFWVNNHAHVLQGKNGISTEHLLLSLREATVTPFVTGAVQPKLNQGNMNRIPFVLPTSSISDAFARTINPLFAKHRANVEESRTLAAIRDALLPKLLSGEIRVGDAERITEEVA